MNSSDNEKYLQQLLEGRLKPGEDVYSEMGEEEYLQLRETLEDIAGLESSDVIFEKEKVWQVMEKYRNVGKNRRRISAARWWSAAVAVLLLAGTMAYMNLHTPHEVLPESGLLRGGGATAYLLTGNGEELDLSLVAHDTTLILDGVRIRLDTAKNAVYEMAGVEAEMVYNTIVVPRKGEYRLVLADGSKVWLNSESRLRFPTFFSGKERRIFLEGEAYLEVAPDAEMPFVVETREVDVRVLGTRFNVNAYASNAVIRTTLASGKVAVDDHRSGKEQLLHPGQQAEWKEGIITTREVDVDDCLSWKEGKFCFVGATLEEISGQLQRWYDIEIIFSSEKLRHYAFAGVISKEYTAGEIFAIIEKTTHVVFDIGESGVVTVRE